tara:strand:+ start:7640 stop:8140 length:501 start_codon:yes stop_codon:yes gene_type:complete
MNLDEIAELTKRWSLAFISSFPKWQLDELHNEAFLIAVHLVKSGRYKPERSKLSTFLWHALPLDVRHRYRKQNGERYLKTKDGKAKYRKTEIVSTELVEKKQQSKPQTFVEVKSKNNNTKVNQEWLIARIEGYKPRELRKRGISYENQRAFAKELRNELKQKRKKR